LSKWAVDAHIYSKLCLNPQKNPLCNTSTVNIPHSCSGNKTAKEQQIQTVAAYWKQSSQLGLTVKMSSTKTYETPNKMQSVPCCTDLNSFTGQKFRLITCHLQRHMIEWNTESISLLAVVQNSVNWITTENSEIYQSFRLYFHNQKISGTVHLHHLKQSLNVTSFNPKYEQIISRSYVCARETQFTWFWPLNHP
jgi:hypothetical protein